MSTDTTVKKLTRYHTNTRNEFIDNPSRTNALEGDDFGPSNPLSRYSAENEKPRDVSPYLLTVKQTAQRLQLGINCVYGLTKAEYNPLPTVVIGRSIRIPVAALERWLEARTRG